MRTALAFALCQVLFISSTFAWVYPEHRDIAVRAVLNLEPKHRMVLDALWAEARRGYEGRLTVPVVDTTQGSQRSAIDFAAWSGISGDHSCSPRGMISTVLTSSWIIDVSKIADDLKTNLAAATRRDERVNALRDSDIRLQRADPEYATRAGSNNVHFMLPRTSEAETAAEYGAKSIKESTDLNAIGAYSYYHMSALAKADQLHDVPSMPDSTRQALILAMLADEAFALHFLEDCYSSGHVVGTWGNASLRKGTHDYYCEHGMETVRWDGRRIVLSGDAYMRDEDVRRAAEAVSLSLTQLMEAAQGSLPIASTLTGTTPAPDAFDVCVNNVMPAVSHERSITKEIVEVYKPLPVPGLRDGLGSLPRFRAELGPFIGLAPAATVYGVNAGFQDLQTRPGSVGGLGVALRFGLGLEGVMNEAGDGLAFLDVGFRQDAHSSMSFYDGDDKNLGGGLTSAIPARNAFTGRIRMPFWLIPGDLILAAPLALFDPDAYTAMAVIAGNGGLIPWQTGMATSFGRFQFMLGREVGVSFFGYGDEEDRAFVATPNAQGDLEIGVVSFRSIQIELPFLEYRPFRSFSLDQSSSLTIQFTAGADIPTVIHTISPATMTTPTFDTIYYLGIRGVFDWRSYF